MVSLSLLFGLFSTALLAPVRVPGSAPGSVAGRPVPTWRHLFVHGRVSGAQPDLYLSRPRLLLTRLDADRVRLHWSAVPETDTQGYWVERSADADHWQRTAYVPLSRTHRYCFQDTTRAAVYYRLVRLDFTRRLSASPPVRSSYGVPLGPLSASPNPARGPVRLLGRDPGLSVDVLNGRGELVHQIFNSAFTTDGLHPGVYALRQGQQITRFVVR